MATSPRWISTGRSCGSGISARNTAVFRSTGSTAPARSEERRVGKECRSLCDWSSDVCSSDLNGDIAALDFNGKILWQRHLGEEYGRFSINWIYGSSQIGRASCRERV